MEANREISALQRLLGLRVIPGRIEAFDISNIHGKEAVGSMVSFFSGKPRKDEYRRFRIKDIVGIDGAIITNPKVWEASGHIENFTDIAVICKKCKNKFKVDESELNTAK